MLATELLKRAAQKLGAIGIGQDLGGDELDIALSSFNAFLNYLSTQKINVFNTTQEALTLTAALPYHTIGISDPVSNLNTVRPVKVLYARLTIGGVDYPIDVSMTEGDYNDISIKTILRRPFRLWYDPQFPLGIIRFDCYPDQAYSFTLSSVKRLIGPVVAETDMAMPEGYDAMFLYNLPIWIADDFKAKPSQSILAIASETLNAVRNNNITIESRRFPNILTSIRGGGGVSGNGSDINGWR